MNTQHQELWIRPLMSQGLSLIEASKQASLEKALDGFTPLGVINDQLFSKHIVYCKSFAFFGKVFTTDKLGWIFSNKIATNIQINPKLMDQIKGLPFHQEGKWLFTIINDNGLTIFVKGYYIHKSSIKQMIDIILVH